MVSQIPLTHNDSADKLIHPLRVFVTLGEAAGGQGSLKKDMVPYDGSKSHIACYNFCYLCKERLDTYYDD